MTTQAKLRSLCVDSAEPYKSATQPLNPEILEVPDLADFENDIYGLKDGIKKPNNEQEVSPKFALRRFSKPIVMGRSVTKNDGPMHYNQIKKFRVARYLKMKQVLKSLEDGNTNA